MSDEFRKIPRSYSTELERATQEVHNVKHATESVFETDSGGRHSKRFLAMGLVLVLGGIIVASLLFLKRSSKTTESQTTKKAAHALVVDQPLAQGIAGKWRGETPKVVAERFLAATTNEERLHWVKNPDSVAEIMLQFYQDGPGKSLKSTKLTQLPQNIALEETYAQFAVSMDDGSARLLCVPYAENGGGGVDFKCYSLYGSASWNDLLSGSATKAEEVRVILEPSTYYNGEFSDEKKWQSLIATSPDIEDVLYFYIPREDPSTVNLMIDPSKSAARFTVGIESIGKSYEKRQFLITHLVRRGWMSE